MTSLNAPVVTRDPRFNAGRSLVSKGLAAEGAVPIFESLAEETANKYGESSIETAPAFYEYGNALLRAANRRKLQAEQEETTPSLIPKNAAAAAAEKRLGKSVKDEDEEKKPAANNIKDGKAATAAAEEEANDDETDDDDVELALTMMENAFSILDEYKCGSDDDKNYMDWVIQSIPRILMGIGDTLSSLDRHADAADAYSRALELYQETLERIEKESLTLPHLTAHRRVCESAVLIAEELLFCPEGQDIVTSETKSLIVSSDEKVEYISGYYDRARDSLQETIFFMAKLAASGADVQSEKEEICHLSTMIMGVGMQLAEIEEKAQAAEESVEPAKKKTKTF